MDMLNLLGCGIVCSLLTTLCWLWRLNKKTALIEVLAKELREAGNEINRLQQKIDQKVAFSMEMGNLQKIVRLYNYRQPVGKTGDAFYLDVRIYTNTVKYSWEIDNYRPVVDHDNYNLNIEELTTLLKTELNKSRTFKEALSSVLKEGELSILTK